MGGTPQASGANAAADSKDIKVAKASGANAKTVAEIHAQHTALKEKPVAVQGIGRDVTERKRAEAELLRRNQELGALNEISHELSKLGEPIEIARLIHSMVGTVIDNRNLYVALYDEQKNEVSFPAYTINGQPVQARKYAPPKSSAARSPRT